MPQNLINEINNQYGSLIVLEKTKDKQGRTAWLCKCACGNLRIARGSDLRLGKITTCGKKGCSEKRKRNQRFIDETGNQYGRLTVLKRAPYNSKNNKVMWECECSCEKHNHVFVLGDSLRKGLTKSCGCLHSEMLSQQRSLNLTNQRFGKLIALNITEEQDKYKNNYWLCKCDCGNIIKVTATSLKSGNTQSCGCLISSNELIINNILNKLKIDYKTQYSFSDLYSPYSTKKFRFDFAIFNKEKLLGLIEYHGEQHYKPIQHFGGEKAFNLRKEYDNIKEQYCKQHNLPLLILNKYNHNLENDILNFYKGVIQNNG